jgi:hypothetical protein
MVSGGSGVAEGDGVGAGVVVGVGVGAAPEHAANSSAARAERQMRADLDEPIISILGCASGSIGA